MIILKCQISNNLYNFDIGEKSIDQSSDKEWAYIHFDVFRVKQRKKIIGKYHKKTQYKRFKYTGFIFVCPARPIIYLYKINRDNREKNWAIRQTTFFNGFN